MFEGVNEEALIQWVMSVMQAEEEKAKSDEEPKVDQNPPRQPEGPEERSEGRKLYVTKYGEKYHFDAICKCLNG